MAELRLALSLAVVVLEGREAQAAAWDLAVLLLSLQPLVQARTSSASWSCFQLQRSTVDHCNCCAGCAYWT